VVGQLQTRLLAGRYRLEELLGGTDAEVYRAIDEQLGRTVAVKIARSGSSGFEPERFANEMRVLAGLRHPGLVTLYDAGTADDGAPYLVMQYVAGVTLAARLRDGLPAAEEVRRIGAALAGALDHLHADGIVHRDIKPANVLISDDGEVYLADLGIARARDTAGLTDTGLVVGTPAYLAPEQVAGRTVGPACDLYALGLVLLECFTGRREYQGTPVEAAMARLSRQPVIPAGLPAYWRRLLAELTALRPAARPTARQVAERLVEEPTIRDLRIVPPPRRRRRRLATLAVGTAALGLAVLATAWPDVEPAPPAPPVKVGQPAPTTAPAPAPRTSTSPAAGTTTEAVTVRTSVRPTATGGGPGKERHGSNKHGSGEDGNRDGG